jgi:type IV pilus assembly protein PilM
VALDWQLIEGKIPPQGLSGRLKVLLVAVPNEIINQYQQIAELSDLTLLALEAEVFGLMRSLIKNKEEGVVSLIDIGARTTTCSIVDNGVLKISHSFDISGDDFTERITRGLETGEETAESLKRKYGILFTPPQFPPESRNIIKEILLPSINIILKESEKIFENFYLKEGREVDKIILAGGTALLPGLVEYFQNYFKRDVELANPFRKIFFPPILEKSLKEMGPAYAIAVGMALRGFE